MKVKITISSLKTKENFLWKYYKLQVKCKILENDLIKFISLMCLRKNKNKYYD